MAYKLLLLLALLTAFGASSTAYKGPSPRPPRRSLKSPRWPPSPPSPPRPPPSPPPKPYRRLLACGDVPFILDAHYSHRGWGDTLAFLELTITRLPSADVATATATSPAPLRQGGGSSSSVNPSPPAGGGNACSSTLPFGNPTALRLTSTVPIFCKINCTATVDNQFVQPASSGKTVAIPLGDFAARTPAGGSFNVILSFDVDAKASPSTIENAIFGPVTESTVAGIAVVSRSLRYMLVGGIPDAAPPMSCYPTCHVDMRWQPLTVVNGTEPGGGSVYDSCYPTIIDRSCEGALSQCGFSYSYTNVLAFARRNQASCNLCGSATGFTPAVVAAKCSPAANSIKKYCCAM